MPVQNREATKFMGASVQLPKLNTVDDIKAKLHGIVDAYDLPQIAEFIEVEIENQQKQVGFNYKYTGFMEDVAYAVNKAIETILGYSQHANGPWGSPPQTIVVNFADGSNIKVPWGKINLTPLGRKSVVAMDYDSETRTFYLNGNVQKQYAKYMDLVDREIRRILKHDSIYKNTAIILGSDLSSPSFMSLEGIKSKKLILSAEQQYNLEPIITRLTKAEKVIDAGLDLKYGALLAGPYGTGKTLIATKLADMAIDNDWSFIYLKDPKKAAQALDIAYEMSTNGTGCFLFTEDIDLVMSGERGDNNGLMNRILNNMDGAENKGKDVITMFTTNHLDRIDPTFMRGKRISSLIYLDHLDKATAVEFIGDYFPQGIDGDVNVPAQLMEDFQIVPAFAAEILEAVQVRMLLEEVDAQPTETAITASIKAFKYQIDLARVKDAPKTPAQLVADGLGEIISTQVREVMDKSRIDGRGNEVLVINEKQD